MWQSLGSLAEPQFKEIRDIKDDKVFNGLLISEERVGLYRLTMPSF